MLRTLVKLDFSNTKYLRAIACVLSLMEASPQLLFCIHVFAECVFQVLRQLAPDVSYRSLVMLGIASIQGLSVASFEKEDADRLLFFCTREGKEPGPSNYILSRPPSWLVPPPPSRKRSSQGLRNGNCSLPEGENGINVRQKRNVAALRPIPHTRHHKMLPFSGIPEAERYEGDQIKPNATVIPSKHGAAGPAPVTNRKSSSSYQAQQMISLNPLPLKKHDCNRPHIQVCSEVNKCTMPWLVVLWL